MAPNCRYGGLDWRKNERPDWAHIINPGQRCSRAEPGVNWIAGYFHSGVGVIHTVRRRRRPADMSKALSLGLRVRVLAAVVESASHRVAAGWSGVSVASVSRWGSRARQEGDPRTKALGGDRRTGRIEAHRDAILELVEETPDITIQELREDLAGRMACTLATARSSALSSATG